LNQKVAKASSLKGITAKTSTNKALIGVYINIGIWLKMPLPELYIFELFQ